MKTVVAAIVLSALTIVSFPAPVAADVVRINSNTYAAVAYSLKTGKYGYAWNHSSRSAADKAALANCPEPDAKIVGWAKFGWAVLVIAEDNAYGCAATFNDGASSSDAYKKAVKELRKHSRAKVKTIVIVCSGDVEPKVIKVKTVEP